MQKAGNDEKDKEGHGRGYGGGGGGGDRGYNIEGDGGREGVMNIITYGAKIIQVVQKDKSGQGRRALTLPPLSPIMSRKAGKKTL